MSSPLSRLGAHVATRAGLRMPDWVLEARVKDRVIALGMTSLDSYVALVMGPEGAREMATLVEALRVGETRFFRHAAQMKALADEVLPDIKRTAGDRRVRVWSAGCATGEEAYTLAMLLHRSFGGSRTTCQVLATDLSEDALAFARRGTYPASALAQVPESLRGHCFERTGDGWSVTPNVAGLVSFERHNLTDADYPVGFDLILCRNVLIYFESQARRRVIGKLIHSLRPGGYLFVGYAESLRDVDDLEVVHTADGVLFRRPPRPVDLPPRRRPPPTTPPPRASASPSRAPAAKPRARGSAPTRSPETIVVSLHGSYGDGTRLSKELSAAIAGSHRTVEVHLDGAEYLGDEAVAVIRRARSAAGSAGMEMRLVASRPGTRRWLERGGLTGSDGGDES